jgi:hypothetical protein
MFDLGILEDSGFLRSLADYVHAVERFKFGHGRVDRKVDEKNRQLMPVFVSHSGQDGEWCREFFDRLRRANVDVWYDDYKLAPGKLIEQLEHNIEQRPAFIVVVTESSIRSNFVRHEARTAIELCEENPDRIVMPIKAGKCDVPQKWSEYVYLRNAGDKPMSPAQAAVKALEMLTRPASA